MNMLYVDVDGTLIDENDIPNEDVVRAVKIHHLQCSDWRGTVIWSGGGKDYADLWRRRLFNEEEWPFMAIAKFPARELDDSDVVVDDEDVKAPGIVLTPDKFIDWVND